MNRLAWATVITLLLASQGALGHTEGLFKQVDFEQRLGASVPGMLRFVDESGRESPLAAFSGDEPVVLVLGYLDCPNLCATVLAGVSEALIKSGLAPGKEYRALFVSIDPRDDASKAKTKKARYLPDGAAGAWRFLTGTKPAIDGLAKAIGFRYVYDADLNQYAHPGGFVVLAPDGRVSRYFFGARYQPWELRLALSEAAGGRIGSLRDRLLLLCYHYDPQAGRYNFAIMNGLRAASLLFLLAAGGLLWRRSRRAS